MTQTQNTHTAPPAWVSPNVKVSNNIISQNIKKVNNIFEQAKNQLHITDAVQYYGVQLNRSNFGCCPFHSERTASFKIYPNGYKCFGCGVSGDVITFVMKLFNLTNIEAVKKLDVDFRLNLPLDKSLSKDEYRKVQIEAEKREQDKNYVQKFELWEKQAFLTLSRRYWKLRDRGNVILTPDDPNFQEHISGLAELPYIEYLLDLMIANMHDFKAQLKFYKAYENVVKRYE